MYPDQNVRLAVEINDHDFASGTLRKVLQEGSGDSHPLEPLTRLRF
jgi:hypothetical protein